MKNQSTRNTTGELTAKDVFELYAGSDEKTFISNFHHDRPPVKDIKKMCKIFAMEIPENEGVLFSLEELKDIEGLLFEHLESYVKNKGGMNKLDLYTEEELNKTYEEATLEIMEAIVDRYGIAREEISLLFRGMNNRDQTKEIK